MNTEPTRQIHLDFHTSPQIPEIGARFSRDQFQRALKLGRVNLINVFAKCHHSYCYYPTRIGMVHPNLDFDLLGEQIEACHQIGVTAPVYLTVGWSADDAEMHPEWCMRNRDGSIVRGSWDDDAEPTDPKPTVQWKSLCPSGEYHRLVVAQTEEICSSYPVDGMWYDIYQPNNLCFCERCTKGMRDRGYDLDAAPDVARYRGELIKAHCEDLVRVITAAHPGASIYFNGLTQLERPENFAYRLFENNTKHDLEDLPTTWGGYDKLPIRAKLFHKEDKPIVAMSGKFHTSWGEFGGFKDPEAIRFEAANMVAHGVRCNFGDQLHPSGEMDLTTYANIGHAYEYIESIESYGIGGTPESSLGLWVAHDLEADEGLGRMLLEEQIDFDVVSSAEDLGRFETIVIPSKAGILEGYSQTIESYLAAGGTAVVVADGLLDTAGIETTFDCGSEFAGRSEYDVDYTIAGDVLSGPTVAPDSARDAIRRSDLPSTPFLNYTPALRLRLGERSEALAGIHEPYFSRTYGAYCGHQNTPYRLEATEYPAVYRYDGVILIAHPIDRMYYQHGAKVHRTLFSRALRLVHHRPMIEALLPSSARVNLLHQPEHDRYVAHLLYGPPIQRGRCQVIEDLPSLHDVAVTLRLPRPVTSLTLVPGDTPLNAEVESFETSDGEWTFCKTTVPSFRMHCVIVAEYEA